MNSIIEYVDCYTNLADALCRSIKFKDYKIAGRYFFRTDWTDSEWDTKIITAGEQKRFAEVDYAKYKDLIEAAIHTAQVRMGMKVCDAYQLYEDDIKDWLEFPPAPAQPKKTNDKIPEFKKNTICPNQIDWMIETCILTMDNCAGSQAEAISKLESNELLSITYTVNILRASNVYSEWDTISDNDDKKLFRRYLSQTFADIHNIPFEMQQRVTDWSLHNICSMTNKEAQQETATEVNERLRNEMKTARMAEMYGGTRRVKNLLVDSDLSHLEHVVAGHMIAGSFYKDELLYNPCAEIKLNEPTLCTLMEKPMEILPTLSYTTITETKKEVFGVVIKGLSKDKLMHMIREAKKHARTFEDLADDSTYVAKQMEEINKGIKALVTELDKK